MEEEDVKEYGKMRRSTAEVNHPLDVGTEIAIISFWRPSGKNHEQKCYDYFRLPKPYKMCINRTGKKHSDIDYRYIVDQYEIVFTSEDKLFLFSEVNEDMKMHLIN